MLLLYHKQYEESRRIIFKISLEYAHPVTKRAVLYSGDIERIPFTMHSKKMQTVRKKSVLRSIGSQYAAQAE